MLHIQVENLTKVGRLHGISELGLRNFCDKKQPLVKKVFSLKSKPGYAFLTLPDAEANLKKVKKYVKEQEKNNWKNIVVLGIGGSALGAIAVRDALKSEFSKGPKLYVLDNIDPAYTAELLDGLNLSRTLFVVISKSGTTTEPMIQYGLVKEILVKKFPKNYQKHLVFVTDPKGGLLRKIAKAEKITAFDIPPKIGGRFSVLTNVGLLPCALAGMEVGNLLKGAREMREAIKRSKGMSNPALALAAAQFILDKKKKKSMTVLMPYSNYLLGMGDWYRQLLAESIGKNRDSGPTPINALGTTDQHSQLQLYSDGPNNKFFIFMRLLKHAKDPKVGNVLPDEIAFLNGKKFSQVIDAAYLGTSKALTRRKHPNVTIEVPKVNAKSIGALFMLFEFQIALLGLLYKVDAFSQPGVEHSKQITKKFLKGEK
ncbi:MAG TPA: glucose-6-phosphate isomerase [Thermodesulforhabdus norvegica]|uniref:Glucose-6-phosphate isomerase n=1 Tax=Thermodesulforhabdus norvegica TaxID=39841 RepID=A0A7C1AWM8_9BACT|nr:glucose-6-phosphate isomerase [Thermodesulforhabdus norvegica]